MDEADATICARVLLAKLAADPGAAPDEVRRFGREAVSEERSEAVFRFFTGWYRLTSPVSTSRSRSWLGLQWAHPRPAIAYRGRDRGTC